MHQEGRLTLPRPLMDGWCCKSPSNHNSDWLQSARYRGRPKPRPRRSQCLSLLVQYLRRTVCRSENRARHDDVE